MTGSSQGKGCSACRALPSVFQEIKGMLLEYIHSCLRWYHKGCSLSATSSMQNFKQTLWKWQGMGLTHPAGWVDTTSPSTSQLSSSRAACPQTAFLSSACSKGSYMAHYFSNAFNFVFFWQSNGGELLGDLHHTQERVLCTAPHLAAPIKQGAKVLKGFNWGD